MSDPTEAPSRRVVLGGAAAVGAGAVLAACGGGSEAPEGTASPESPAPIPSDGWSQPPPASGAKVADVPVGTGIIAAEAKAVITQPKAGEFKAFDWTCSHKGCPVKTIVDDTITCPCHGSQYSIADGSVKKGPATRGLTELTVTQEGGELKVER